MTGIEYLNSEDCPNIKAGMGLSQIQLYVIAGILEAYHKKQLTIHSVVDTEGECCESGCDWKHSHTNWWQCTVCKYIQAR